MKRTKTTEERFWRHVNKSDTCWYWTASDNGCGYGQFNNGKGRSVPAHRYSWELHNGVIPDRLCVLHKCDVRWCVNPSHLFLGTRTDNAKDRDAKLRQGFGEKHPNARIKASDALKIISEYKSGRETLKSLSARFGVCKQQVHRIVTGQQWSLALSVGNAT